MEIEALKAAFERLASRPVAWNGRAPLRETLLGLYKTEVDMHKMLAARANELEQMGGFVQVVFEWQLSFGDELWFTCGATERVPLRPLFGNVRQHHEGSNVYYLAGFNLT